MQINEYFYHLQGRDLFVQKNHSHNEIEFIQVIEGNGLVLKNDKTYVLRKQHLYVIDARRTHIVYPQPEDCNNYIRNKIVIDADSFMSFYENIGMGDILYRLFDSGPISTAENPGIDTLYKTITELCRSKKSENTAFAYGYITELIHWLYLNSETKAMEENKGTFQKVLDIINEKEGITTLCEISDILHIDKYYLCRMFKEKTGTKLSSYLSDKVFEKSRNLLESTPYPVEKIAFMCGFSSSASLSRFFKNKCGASPTEYRKNIERNIKLYF